MKFLHRSPISFFASFAIRRTVARAALALLAGVGMIPAASAQQTATVTTLYTFTGGNDGSQPQSLLIAGDGNFYGAAVGDGTNSHGTIFKFTPAGELTTLYSFTGGNDGSYPVPGLVQDDDGNLYGVTSYNGANNHGTIFKVTPTGVFTLLHSFTGNELVGYPTIGLARGTDGNFYGTGDYPYRITPAGDFTLFTNNPYVLQNGVILGQNGNFYAAGRIGSNGTPTVVQVSPSGEVTPVGTYNVPRVIPMPFTSLTQGSNGNLYGTVNGTGYNGDGGTVFRLTLDGTYTRLAGFYTPQDSSITINSKLVEGSDGSFYGATVTNADEGDGTPYNPGTLYQLTPDGKFTTLYHFPSTDINSPGAFYPQPGISLVLGPDGNLYGTTKLGGTHNAGAIFKVTLHPAFFAGAATLDNGVYYLTFSTGNYFGYYSFLSDSNYLYHFDLGYEYVFNANDGKSGVYLYDFKSGDFFYTSPSFPFPYLYDFSLNSVVYYYPDPNPNNPGHYNTNGIRYFYVFNTGEIISK